MRIRNRDRALGLAALVAVGLATSARADEAIDAFSERVRAAMAAEIRTPEETARDANRKPVETLAFFGIRGDMDVLELVPGGGWYTKLLAPALAEEGSLSVWVGIGRFADRVTSLGFDDVKVVAPEAELVATDRRGIFDLATVDLGSEAYDAVLTFRNLHNLTADARANLNAAVFAALRPGGVYGVVDHTRRHMQPDDPENRRRLDPVAVIHEALAAGFAFEGFSDLHYRLDDELRYEVGRRSVSGNTDRFTLRFRRPR
jgi:predicted methyltransferase